MGEAFFWWEMKGLRAISTDSDDHMYAGGEFNLNDTVDFGSPEAQ
jgi:hypothetical protein